MTPTPTPPRASTPDRALRVAIDVGPLYGHRTGVGFATAGIVGALRDIDGVELAPYVVSGRATPRDGDRKLPLPGIVASHVWSRSGRPRADRWLRDADVVHGTNYVAPPTAKPTVISVYDCWFLRHPELASPVVRRAGHQLRRAVRRGAWLHTTSEATAAAAGELLGTDRIRTVFLGGPDAPTEVLDVPADLTGLSGSRYLLALGTEERRKDIPLLIEAFGHLAGDHHDLQLVIAGGGGDDSRRISATIDRSRQPTKDRIQRLGPVDERAKAWLLRHATALVYPSLDEGFGFPVLEAQAAGTPVVAMAVGSIPEIAGDPISGEAAVLVDDPTRQPMRLAEAIDGLLGGSRRLGLIEAGYRNVRRFRWDTTAARLVDLYRTALEDR